VSDLKSVIGIRQFARKKRKIENRIGPSCYPLLQLVNTNRPCGHRARGQSFAPGPSPLPAARYKRHRAAFLGRSPANNHSRRFHPPLAATSSGGTLQSGSILLLSLEEKEEEDSSMSTAALLGAKGKEDAGEEQPPATTTWLSRVVDTAEARAQLRFAVPMVLTNMAYYGIPLVSVMFSGHLLGSDVHLAGATLGNSWATVTGYAFVVRARPISSPKDHFLLCRLFCFCACARNASKPSPSTGRLGRHVRTSPIALAHGSRGSTPLRACLQ
jgi:hypothetical protein